MAYLVIKRIYQNEILSIAGQRMSKVQALETYRDIATFPSQLDRETRREDAEGELWIEVETEQGDTETDPVCFPAESAHTTLVRLGVLAEDATRLLSNSYAEQWLKDYYGAMSRNWGGADA